MNIDEVLLINSSAIAFVFGCFNIHQKDWLTYSGGTDRPGKLCCYHRRPTSLQMFNFPTWIPNCDLHSHALLDLFISSVASFCSTMALPPSGNSDHVVVSVSIDFPSNFPSRFLEAAKPIYVNKTKESITFQKLGSRYFWQIANIVVNKGRSVIFLHSTAWRCCLLHLIKQNCLLKTFQRTLIL